MADVSATPGWRQDRHRSCAAFRTEPEAAHGGAGDPSFFAGPLSGSCQLCPSRSRRVRRHHSAAASGWFITTAESSFCCTVCGIRTRVTKSSPHDGRTVPWRPRESKASRNRGSSAPTLARPDILAVVAAFASCAPRQPVAYPEAGSQRRAICSSCLAGRAHAPRWLDLAAGRLTPRSPVPQCPRGSYFPPAPSAPLHREAK